MADGGCCSGATLGCISAIALPIVLFAGCMAISTSVDKDTTSSVATVVKIGTIVHLDDKDMDSMTTVFATEQSAKTFLGSAGRGDKEGALNEWLSGRVFQIPKPTQVRVIGYGGFMSGLTHIRILEGDHYAEDAWVPIEWVAQK